MYLKIRDDLSFQKCIVTEVRFGRKKIFFTVLYRNPFYKADTTEFMNFITELELLVSKIKLEKPYVMLFAETLMPTLNHGMLMVTQIVKVFNCLIYFLIST